MTTHLRLADEPQALDLTQLMGHVATALRGIADALDSLQCAAALPAEPVAAPDEPPLLAEDAAAALNLPYRTFMRKLHEGEIGYLKPGRRYLIPRAEITRYLASASRREAS